MSDFSVTFTVCRTHDSIDNTFRAAEGGNGSGPHSVREDRHRSLRRTFFRQTFVDILLKDVFAGDGKGDTLFFVSCLDARLRIDALPDSIAVRSLKLDNLVAHTGDLIPSVRIDGMVGRLSARVKPFTFDRLTFPITDAVLKDADIVLGVKSKFFCNNFRKFNIQHISAI